jgi:predicted nucleic acid-binding protein
VVNECRRFRVIAITPQLVTKGISRSIDTRISFWDGLIVEAALSAGTNRLVTEDLQYGWQIGTMRVWNPFR